MKNLMALFILATLMMRNDAFAQQHDHSSNEMDHESQMKMAQPMTFRNVDESFKEQLTRVYQESLGMNKAFVNSNGTEVIQAANNVDKALQQVNMHLLEGDAHMEWMKDLNALKKNLEGMKGTADISAQRKYFAGFTRGLYKSIKTFGVNDSEIFYQYCPMALDNQGAYWLSDTQEIHNPYFGEKMLSCGSVKEVLEF